MRATSTSALLTLLGWSCSLRFAVADTWTKIYGFYLPKVVDIASSGQGDRLITGIYNGGIVYSTDGGLSWNPSDAPVSNWYGFASRDDGKVAIAQVNPGGLYMSTNYGANWVPISGAPTLYWNGISSSSDGSTWFATSNSPNAVYVSTDGGFTWTEVTSSFSPSLAWTGISCNYDCSTRYGSDQGGYIYKSTDKKGSHWTAVNAPSSLNWTTVFSSRDASRVAALSYGGDIFLSTDSGTSFYNTSTKDEQWQFITGTGDCGQMFASNQMGEIWKSSNLFPSFSPTSAPTPLSFDVSGVGTGSFFQSNSSAEKIYIPVIVVIVIAVLLPLIVCFLYRRSSPQVSKSTALRDIAGMQKSGEICPEDGENVELAASEHQFNFYDDKPTARGGRKGYYEWDDVVSHGRGESEPATFSKEADLLAL